MKYHTFLVTTQDLQTVSIFIMDEDGQTARHSVDETDGEFDRGRFFLLNPDTGFEEWFLPGLDHPLEEISQVISFHKDHEVSLYEGGTTMTLTEIERPKMQEEGDKRYLLNRASCILWNEGTKYTDLRMSDLDSNTVVATLEDGTHRLIHGASK